jgi:hypothetical protein
MTKFCQIKRPLSRLIFAGIIAGAMPSCSLEVFDPDIIQPEDVADPASIPVVIAGLVGDFQLAVDEWILYGGLITDEFITAGTFPTRREVQERQMLVANVSLNTDLWEPIHTSRFSADNAVANLLPLVGDPELEDRQELILEGIAFGQYYGAYARVMLAEMWCQSILGGGEPDAVNYESAPIGPDARMAQALTLFQEAETSATAAGLPAVAEAARIGQARANMWLGNYQQAAGIAASVDPDFEYVSEYSSNDISQYNRVYTFTYGDGNDVIRWTVGDGTEPTRFLEKFAYFDEWVNLGLILPNAPNPPFQSFDSQVVVQLQLIYGGGNPPPSAAGQSTPIIIASGFEADIYRAEALYRAGDITGAAALINSRITDPGANPHGRQFAPVSFTGDFETDIVEIGRAYSAGMWLTGQRHGFFRRLFLNDNVDLFPASQPGQDTAFPIPNQELDNNPDLSQSCPSGPPYN